MTSLTHPETASAPHPILATFQPPSDRFNELLDPTGNLRPQWKHLIQNLEHLGKTEIRQRWDRAVLLLRENGVTYHIYGEEKGLDRPWMLDPIPFILPMAEWQTIEKGIQQRAALLNLIMADLYGPQKLLHNGIIPPSLIFSHPGFLHPCHGITPSHNSFLQLYACDLARSPDGTWWVVSDRAQAPSGSGYALENRAVISRIFPDIYHGSNIEKLSEYFLNLRSELASLSRETSPRTVILTPGPYNETYFEHAYLSRHLGFILAQGSDLTVRDDRLYLKTVGGLNPVHILIRRVDDDFCDPLELRDDSFLGIPGLLHAARQKNVVIANALGSGLLQNRGLLAFLPAACKHLLNEELLIPSVATWWCGQRSVQNQIWANRNQLVFLPTHEHYREKFLEPSSMTPTQLEAFQRQLAHQGHQFAAQEYVRLSHVPVWAGDQITSRPMSLRVHLCRKTDGSWITMPGGLTRYASDPNATSVSMQRGNGSKDTWILSPSLAEPRETITLPSTTTTPIPIHRIHTDLPSRIADDLYWLGRHTERAESLARIVRTILTRMHDESTLEDSYSLQAPFWCLVRRCTLSYQPFNSENPAEVRATIENLLSTTLFLIHPRSISGIISQINQTQDRLRDRLHHETSRSLRQISQFTARPSGSFEQQIEQTLHNLDSLIFHLAAFHGHCAEDMTHNFSWRSLDLGKRIERSLHMIDLAQSLLWTGDSTSSMILEPVLEIAESSITYRLRYLSPPQLAPALDLLIADESNPRSLGYQFKTIHDHILAMPHTTPNNLPPEEEKIALGNLTRLRLLNLHNLVEEPYGPEFHNLQQTLADWNISTPQLSESIIRNCFNLTHYSQMLDQSAPLLTPNV